MKSDYKLHTVATNNVINYRPLHAHFYEKKCVLGYLEKFDVSFHRFAPT